MTGGLQACSMQRIRPSRLPFLCSWHTGNRPEAWVVLAAILIIAAPSRGQSASGTVREWGARVIVPGNEFRDFIAISTGQSHCLGLKADGSIVAWGWNASGQCQFPVNQVNSDFKAVAAGFSHSIGLKSDGSVVVWGDNTYGQRDRVPNPNVGFEAVAAGGHHCLALKNGVVFAWGRNDSSQCQFPVDQVNSDFKAVAAGFNHSLGLKNNGSVVAWGNWHNGRTDVPPFGDEKVIAVATSSGAGHSLALKEDGTIVAWGYNRFGQCGAIPVPNANFENVSVGSDHSLGLKQDGSIIVWGAYVPGLLEVPEPNSGFTAIAGGGNYNLGLRPDGSVLAWGVNWAGMCNVPPSNGELIAVAAGAGHRLGLKADGTIVAWGSNEEGQCIVPQGNDFIGIAAGRAHSLGLRKSGGLIAWGSNYENQTYPLPPYTDFVAIAAGDSHSLGHRANGSIAAWGNNRYGQCTVPFPNAGFIAIAASGIHSLGVTEDSTIVTWGEDGVCPPTPNTGFFAVATGTRHSLALQAGGKIVAWGDNSAGQCIVPGENKDFVAVSAYSNHSVGLKSNGTVVAWGENSYDQTTVPGSTSHAIAIAAGGVGNMAIITLASPDTMTATYLAGRRISLTWNDNSEEESGYRLYRSPPDSPPIRIDLASPNIRSYTDTDLLPGLEYTYMVAAYDEWRVSPFVSASETTNAAPVIDHTPPHGAIGQEVTISVQVQHDRPVVGAFVEYRAGRPEAQVLTVPMNSTAHGSWEVRLPAGAVTASGLQYCLKVSDGIDITRYPSTPGFCSIDAILTGRPVFRLPGGDSAENYSMLSLPCVASDPSATNVFDELGEYDPREWRYFRWDPLNSGYIEYPAAHSVLPGQGFWIISREERVVTIDGHSTSLVGPFKLALGPGWNQIANPFSYEVPFTSVVWPDAGGVLHEYTGNASDRYQDYILDEGGVLTPGRAYWYWHAVDAIDDTLRVYPFADMVPAEKAAATVRATPSLVEPVWSAAVRVATESSGDAGYRFGLRSDATDGLDVCDFRAPPPAPGRYASLALLDEDDDALLTDFRNSASEGACWTLCLRSNQVRSDYRVEFTSDTPLPAGWHLQAIDMANLGEQDLIRRNMINGWIGSGAFERRWRILAGSKEYLEGARNETIADFVASIAEFTLLPTAPNPSRVRQTVKVSLAAPRDALVSVRVYDLRGRLVATIHDGQVVRGLTQLAWRGEDGSGRRAATGVYILRLQAPGVDVSRKVTVVH